MQAGAGERSTDYVKFTREGRRRGRLLADVSAAALACWLPSAVSAATYFVSDDAGLRSAITTANGDGDPSSTIVLTQSFTVGTTSLPVTVKPITIDTQGFVLSPQTAATAIALIGNTTLYTLMGSYRGLDGATGGTAVGIRQGASVTNMGLLQGGNGSAGAGGLGVDLGGPGNVPTLTNHGVIRGGTGTTTGHSAILVRQTGSLITNTGTIEAGPGVAAIRGNNASTSLDIVNSGTIRGGGAGANAIELAAGATTGAIHLELQAGSQIFGNVVGNASLAAGDSFRLGGTADASFDASSIGATAQYRNFDNFQKVGSSTWTLTGINNTALPWTVTAGTLLVNGSINAAVTIDAGATLGGSGSITGVVVAPVGGTLAPGGAGSAPGSLTINGNLLMDTAAVLNFDLGQAGVAGGALNDLLTVSGGITLNGTTLNVTTTAGGSFAPGVYRLIDYGGAFIGSITTGSLPSPDFFLQTAVPGQINLINTAGMVLRFWDGPDAPNNGVIGGGNGVWESIGSPVWTNQAGAPNGSFATGAFAVFQGAAGTVTVDTSSGPVIAGGMQFLTNGYIIQGGEITLTGAQAFIRVGDGAGGGGVTATIASNLTGSAQLVKSDLGNLILTGQNSYTSGTVISEGRLVLGNGGTSGSIQGDVAVNGAGLLSFNRSDAVSFGGAISGTGRVAQEGSGTLTLTGANTYSGGTTISAGTLIGSATSFGSAGIFNNAALIIDQPVDATFANQIVGTGSFTKRGAGTLNLTGSSSGLGGATTVAAGKLSVNGSLAGSAVTVLAGASLGGNGTVGATTIQSGATIAPGNSIGTLTVNGNLTLAPGSTYEAEIAGNGTSDRIAVTGIATVTGSQVGVSALDPQTSYINGQRYTILTATGGVAGSAPGAVSRSAFLDLSVDQRPNQVDLVIAVKGTPPVTPPVTPPTDPGTPTDPVTPPVTPPATPPVTPPAPPPAVFQTVAQTPNQYATALGLNSLPQVGGTLALYNSLLVLDAPSARAAFDALSGDAHASAKTALVEESWLLRNAVNDRLRSAFGGVGAAPMATMSYGFTADLAPAVKGPMPRLAPTERFAVWGQGYGSWGRTDTDRNAAKLTRSTGGFLLGADVAAFDTMRFGVIAGYSRSEFDVKGRLSSGESDNYHLGLYGGGQWGALSLRTGASYTWHEIETSRIVAFPGFGNSLRADYNAGTAQVFGELGYRFDVGQVALEPFAGLAYVNLHTDGFNEIGGAAALNGRSDDTSLGYSTLGLRASTAFALSGMDLTLRGGLAWRHAFGDVDPTATLAFAGSSAFTVAGLPIARDAALVEAGLDLAISKSATLGVSYTGQLAQDAQDHAFKANLAVRF
ncbi:autotransporter domain-containing protein [Bosea sp. BK604]|uniref:autotransporter domain-containing protein n=1 Tax=Bosea sp. BK604 TaxID=2512180 RepID=UPI0010498EF9|nr:autotransporter domain-containing protein [Bosea sp. BK604]TCR65670.1 outer membrane autotransporter protein [Bosea sp. BK604]